MKRYSKFITLLTAALLLVSGAGAAAAQSDTPVEAQWYARYWNNLEMEGEPVLERDELVVDYDWGFGSPSSAVNTDGFSAQWTAPVFFEEGVYRFTVTSDDGVRVWLDDEYIVQSWTTRAATTDVATVTLEEGIHTIAVDYFDFVGLASISFGWQLVDDAGEGDEPGDDEPDVTISPLSGPPGTDITVQATGFDPGKTATVGIGLADSEPTTSILTEIPEDGVLVSTITLPEDAEPGEPWRVLVSSGIQSALSEDFIVTAPGDDGQPGICGPTYVVRPGDWLSKIARNCNTTVEAILALNPNITDPDAISTGMVLNMPTSAGSGTVAQVFISPRSGQPGTPRTVIAGGFEPDADLFVYLRRVGGPPTAGFSVTSDDAGGLNLTLEIPESAQPGQSWYVLVSGEQASAESATFLVVDPDEVTATTQFNLNLRTGPGIEFEDIGTVPAGTVLPVLERSPDNNWIRVQYEGESGWLAAWLTEIVGVLQTVPESAD